MKLGSTVNQALAVSVGIHFLLIGMLLVLGVFLPASLPQQEEYLELSLTEIPKTNAGISGTIPTIAAPTTPVLHRQQMEAKEVSASASSAALAQEDAALSTAGGSTGSSSGSEAGDSSKGEGQSIGISNGKDSQSGGNAQNIGRVMPPRILQRTELVYPEAMRRQCVEGKVIVRMLVLEDGSVGEASVVTSSGYGELDEAAVETVQQWRFVPARYENGGPLRSRTTLSVVFRLRE